MILEISMLEKDMQDNIKEVIETSAHAQSDYYYYKVCAMFIDENNNKYKGVNFELSNGKSICAETGAFGSYLLSERNKIKSIIIYGSGIDKEKREDVFCFPCGSCRQMISDFVDRDTLVYAVNETASKVNKVKIKELLPYVFGKDNL